MKMGCEMPTEKTSIVCHVCDENKPQSHFLPGHKICVACEQELNYTKRDKAGDQYPQARRNCENCED